MKKLNMMQLAAAACSTVLLCSQIARAETLYLKCGPTDGGHAVTYAIDLTKETVTEKGGTYTATVTETAIEWVTPCDMVDFTRHGFPYTCKYKNHIDRTTGALGWSSILCPDGGGKCLTHPIGEWQCSKTTAPQTKF